MEEQIKVSAEQYLSLPPRAPRPLRQHKRSPYRYWALILAGTLCYALLIALSALIWGGLLFMNQSDVGEATAIPLAVFLGAVFLSCALVTLLSRGGTVFPALSLTLIITLIPFLIPARPEIQPQDVAIKFLCTLIVAMAGFVLTKMLYIRSRKN